MPVEAKTALFTLEGSKHWIIKTSKELNSSVKLEGTGYTKGNVLARTLFENVKNTDDVRKYVKANKCKIDHITKSKEGVIAAIQCKPSPLDKAVKAIYEKTRSELWIQSNPDDLVNVYIRSPWSVKFKEVEPIFTKYGLKVKYDPLIIKSNMEIVPSLEKPVKNKIDQLDKKIAKTLLVEGYYSSPRPKGLTQEKIAKKLGISKLTLERHLAKIHSMGLQKLFGIKPFTEKEKAASLKLFKKKLKRKEK